MNFSYFLVYFFIASRDGIIAWDIVDLSRCIINGRYREVTLTGDNIIIEMNKQTCIILPT